MQPSSSEQFPSLSASGRHPVRTPNGRKAPRAPSRVMGKGLSSPLQAGCFNYGCYVEIQRKFGVLHTYIHIKHLFSYKNINVSN